jgi:hypothetical protein
MPLSPLGPWYPGGRHAAPPVLSDDVEVLEGEVVDEEPDPTRPGRHHTPNEAERRPMISTGSAGNRWVKWLRARGTEAAPISAKPPSQSPVSPAPAPVPPAPAPSAPAPSAPRDATPVDATPIDSTPVDAAPADATSPADAASPAAAPTAGSRSSFRAGYLIVGAFLLQLAFIGAYVGAWHAPVAHGLPVAIVTSSPVEQFQAQVERETDAVSARTFTSNVDAFAALRDQDVYAVLVYGGGGQLELHVASAAGASAADSLAQLYGKYALTTGVPVQVYDDVPLPASDNRGITPFALVIGWVIGGYLISTLLSFVAGSAPEPRRGRIRILALLSYAILSGISGAVIVGPVLDVWHHNLVALATIGVLIVFGASVISAALSALFSSVGNGLTILLLLVLGNPGSGSPFAPEMLPGPFRELHTWLLSGAATTAVRSIVYFEGRGDTGAYLVLLTWCAVGSALYLGATALGGFRPAHAIRFVHYLAATRHHS